MRNTILLLFMIITLWGCEDKKETENDIVSLNIITPTNNSTVNGVITITISYSGTEELAKIEYYINSNFLGSSTTFPFSYQWNTESLTNGDYELIAIGYYNKQTIVSKPISGNIYNEVPISAIVTFDKSAFPPYDYGYKYSVRTENKNCGNGTEPYPYLTFTAAIKNIGGQTAHNVKVSLSVSVTSNINTNLTFGQTKDFGTLAPNENQTLSFDNRFRAICQYGPYSVQNFNEINISKIVANITWN